MKILTMIALLLQGHGTAEEDFRKIEEAIAKARTVSIRFKYVTSERRLNQEIKVEAVGALLMKEGNRVRLENQLTVGDAITFRGAMISDGSRMVVKEQGATNAQAYDVVSLGEDGREGGEGRAQDLWNHDAWKKK
jgi:outer membrane lipoprotein-sorting protein